MTTTSTTAVPLDGQQAAVRLDRTGPASVVPVTKTWRSGSRTVGVVLVDATGARWQRTLDLERLVVVATLVSGLVGLGAVAAAALRRPTARVDRLTMGPGGWVSFKGGEKPRPRGLRRPWWAHVLRAYPLDRES
jgi:hypothetical protein